MAVAQQTGCAAPAPSAPVSGCWADGGRAHGWGLGAGQKAECPAPLRWVQPGAEREGSWDMLSASKKGRCGSVGDAIPQAQVRGKKKPPQQNCSGFCARSKACVGFCLYSAAASATAATAAALPWGRFSLIRAFLP